MISIEFFVIIGERIIGCILLFLLELLNLLQVHLYFLWLEGHFLGEIEIGISDEFSEQPEERLFILVVAFCADVVVLQVSLSMESDLSRLHLSVLHIHFIADQHDRDLLADTRQILMPFRHVSICYSAAHVEHHDRTMSSDVITIYYIYQYIIYILSIYIIYIRADSQMHHKYNTSYNIYIQQMI